MSTNQFNPLPLTYNYKQAAEILGLAPITLRAWVSQGKIGCFHIGSHVRFAEHHLRDVMRETMPTAKPGR